MNPLRNLVESQFEHPNLGLAALFFSLPFILQIVFWAAFGVAADYSSFFLKAVVPAILSWVVGALILFLMLLAFKGKDAQGHFKGIFAALSIYNLVYFVAMLLVSLLFFFAVPELFTGGPVTQQDVYYSAYEIAQNPQVAHWALLAGGLLMGLATILSYFYIVAKTGQLVKRTGSFSNLVMVLIFSALSVLVSLAISGAFAAL